MPEEVVRRVKDILKSEEYTYSGLAETTGLQENTIRNLITNPSNVENYEAVTARVGLKLAKIVGYNFFYVNGDGSPDWDTLLDDLETARVARGMTKAAVARELGMSKSSLQRFIERYQDSGYGGRFITFVKISKWVEEDMMSYELDG